MILKTALFLLVYANSLYGMLHRQAPKRLPYKSQSHTSRSYSKSSYDVATLNTRIYDSSRAVSPIVAKVQQHFQSKFEQSGNQLSEEICDRIKMSKAELKSKLDIAQWMIEHSTQDPRVLLGLYHRKTIESLLLELDDEFKDVIVVSSQSIRDVKKDHELGFSLHNLVAITPLIIDATIAPIYKAIVGHEAGHIKNKDSVLEYALESYDSLLDKDLWKRIYYFREMRADVYAHTRGPQWPSYGLDYIKFFYRDVVPTEDTKNHPAPSARKAVAQQIYIMFYELQKKL